MTMDHDRKTHNVMIMIMTAKQNVKIRDLDRKTHSTMVEKSHQAERHTNNRRRDGVVSKAMDCM